MIKEALTLLQSEFALIELNGDIRILKKADIRNILAGDRRQTLSFSKRDDAKLLMARLLEATEIPVHRPQSVIEEFYTHPATELFTGTAFSPLTLLKATLRSWISIFVKSFAQEWRSTTSTT